MNEYHFEWNTNVEQLDCEILISNSKQRKMAY